MKKTDNAPFNQGNAGMIPQHKRFAMEGVKGTKAKQNNGDGKQSKTY
jgi:hypothetical protein